VKRLHAAMILIFLAACIAVMIGREAWRYLRQGKVL